MDFKISGRHLEITPPIREFAETKTAKLHRYYDRIQEISVVIDKQDAAFTAEVLLDIEHHEPIVARQKGDDIYACIDQTIDKLERQLTDLKEKLRNRKHLTGRNRSSADRPASH